MTETDAIYFGQFGEDRLLAELFDTEYALTCVEVGANDGVTGSMSLFFERRGWRCILVEPNPRLCERLRVERRAFLFEGAASSGSGQATLNIAEGDALAHAVSTIEHVAQSDFARQGYTTRPVVVRTETLDRILEMGGAIEGEIAFISIDVEGHEREVLNGLTLSRWKPEILIVEDNSLLFGNAIRAGLKRDGYIRFRRTGVNDWYASKQRIGKISRRPEADYLISMIRSRSLMGRRYMARRLLQWPLIGPVLGKQLGARASRRG